MRNGRCPARDRELRETVPIAYWPIALAVLLLGCAADTSTPTPPLPVAECVVTHCWPDYRCGMAAGEVHSCAAGEDVTWSQPGMLGKCGEGPSCVKGELCLVRTADAGDAIGECR